ncbi:MAG: CoA transferase [Bacteroidota bacterium]
MDTRQLFAELTVVELASVLAGPAVGMFFAELGAKVIKIENKRTGGDTTRKWKLPEENPQTPYSVYYHSVNWQKESIFLDLGKKEDYDSLISIVKTADILISNYKADSGRRLGVDYETLAAKNPALIYGQISAYGSDNPKPGFDVVIQAETAWISMNGEPNRTPVKLPVALMDLLTAHQLKEGILVALIQRTRTGRGCKVSASLFDSAVASLANQAANWLNLGKIPQPMGSQHPNIAPYGDTFATKDGRWVITSAGTPKQYEGLLACLELENLKEDQRFASNALRLQHREALNVHLSEAFARFESADLLERCHQQGVPVAPIQDMQELFERQEAQALVLEERMADGYLSKRVKTVVFELGE